MRDNISGGALTETTFLVLLATHTPRHGYGIMQFIDKQTNGRVVLGAGTLYGAINAMVKKRWIAQLDDDGRKKEYLITPEGKEIAARELKRLKEVLELAAKIMKEE